MKPNEARQADFHRARKTVELEKSVDVIVLGGGPAGSSTALALRRRGYSVVVLERSDYRNVRIGETLPPAVQPLFASLGVWEQFLAEKHLPSFGIHSAWGQNDLYDNDFILNPYGPGWHVDRARFDAMLARCAEEAGTSICRNTRLFFCAEDNAGSWQIRVECDDWLRTFRARFVVDATGRASSFACKQGARRIYFDHLIGVVAFLSRSSSAPAPDSFALIEAVENGWWYSAILPDSRLVLAYMTDADLYGKGSKHSSDWQEQLRQSIHTRARVAGYASNGPPFVVAANSSILEPASSSNWLAVGDAATALDPLSGQGVYQALKSGINAAQATADFLRNNIAASRKHALAVHEQFESYLQTRDRFYGREQRWPNSIFWRRRQRSYSRIAAKHTFRTG